MNLQDWTNIATISGIVLALCQFYCSRKDNKNNNERQNGPDFYFTAPEQCERFGVGYCSFGGDFVPKLTEDCSGASLVYFFNLVNCGKFAAKDVRVCIISEEDSKNIMYVKNERWNETKHHSGFPTGAINGDLVPIYVRKGDLLLRADDRKLFILLEYRSSYTRRKYKRTYECCIKDNLVGCHSYNDKSSNKPQFKKMGFDREIAIHDIRLVDEHTKRIRDLPARVLAKVRRRLLHVQSLDDWLLDF